MADGSLKSIENVKEGDSLLAFNHETGALESSKVILAYKGASKSNVLRLFFETTELDIVGQHDLLEQSSMKYAEIAVGKGLISRAELESIFNSWF